MMNRHFPETDIILNLPDEELAVFLLQHLAELERSSSGTLNLNNFLISLQDYKTSRKLEVNRAFTEAWMWLEREGMLAPDRARRDFFYVTKRGQTLLETGDLGAYARGNLLSNFDLEPSISRKVVPTFLRGDYDTAVFQAFKEVEVSVRTAGGFTNDKIGVPLMRDAFNLKDGPLTAKTVESGERQAESDLFAGALGTFKNPSSHRHVDLEDPQKAIEAILLANYLLRVVKGRADV